MKYADLSPMARRLIESAIEKCLDPGETGVELEEIRSMDVSMRIFPEGGSGSPPPGFRAAFTEEGTREALGLAFHPRAKE